MLSRFLLLFLFGFGFGIRGGVCKTPKNMVKRELHNSPIGENQKLYCHYLANKEIPVVVGLGPAGCGKTMFACNAAVEALVSGDVDKIIITRPTVSVDEELGFLPGTLEHKMDPWVRPIFDVLGDFYSKTEVKRLMDDGIIEIAPLAYMRGRTFRRSFLIADEMQNASPNQMLMMLTRIGEDSKMVITGDLQQSDRPGKNGLDDFYSRLSLRNMNEDC
jgi:phosphate starvation-inducible PhoH-like protein